MRPISLKMSAFGPYKDEVYIDFTKFDGNGIFLITGDTGSGKTTIFDAICFALYGVASGSNRNKNSFRSDFSSNERKTFVKLIFMHKGIKYEIERSPSYMRKKIRGEGLTQVSGDASMVYSDRVITGDANVTEECIKILGLNASQFKQISMIAQGEFLKLLLAKSSDRALIFRKIFDTYIYKSISDKLKDKYLDKKREYEDMGININSLRDNLIINSDIDYKDINIEELLNIVSIQNIKDEKRICELNKGKDKLFKDIQKIVSDIDSAKMINDNLDKYKKVKTEIDLKKNIEKDINIKREIVKKNKDIYDNIIPIYNEIIKFKETINNKKNEIKDTKDKLKIVNSNYKDICEKYKNISKLQDDVNKWKVELTGYNNSLSIIEEIKDLNDNLDIKKNIYNLLLINNYNDVLDKFEMVRGIQDKYKSESDKFNVYKDKYNKLSKRYNRDYNKFINCQAGIIASGLKDNDPCPVCGSLNHPKLAKLDNNYITKVDLDNEQLELEECQKELEVITNSVSSLKKEYEYKLDELNNYNEEEIKKDVKECQKNVKEFIDVSKYNLDEVSSDISTIKAQVDAKSSLLGKDIDIDDVNNKIDEINKLINKNIEEIKNINNEYEIVGKEKVKLESIILTIIKEVELLNKDVKDKEQIYVDSYKKLGYSKMEDYLKVMVEEDTYSNYEKEVNDYEKGLALLLKEVEVLKNIIKDKKYVNIVDLVNNKKVFDKELNDIELSLKNINNRLNNNIMIYNKIKDAYDKIKETEKMLSVYEDLSNTANGNIKGKNKLEFEQYVQASYFDKVIVSANKRFSNMTDSRYLLLRKKESNKISDKLGLEIEIFDNYTGKKRDVTSLSGGESFKASLSLALGISDVIQEYAGGIVVDVMFIDEGFGSLDNDSLESAISAIIKLSDNNKLVGIISHVNELKDRIDKKIIVKKSNKGSVVDIVV